MPVPFGLLDGSGNPVPLKKVCVDVMVSGFVAHVQSDLHYANKEVVAIETTFTFPLDDGAAVYRLEAEIEGRRIIAECQEKEQAKRTYDDAIAFGQTAMHLGEHDQTGDIFKCTLGNLPPNTDAKLTLSYVLELPQEHDGKLRFTLPTVLNPRYSPDDGLLVRPEGDYQITGNVPPCSDNPYTLQVMATVQGKQEVRRVTSVTDFIHVEYSPDKLEAKVRLDVEDFKFDHDLTFLVEYEDPHKPQAIIEKGDPEKKGFLHQDLLMVNFYPEIDKTNTCCGEYIFVMEISGSMDGDKIIHATDTLLFFLKSLPVGCYFNIVSFGGSFVSLFHDGSKEYTEKSLSEAIALQKVMTEDMDTTNIYRSLQYIYSNPTINGHPRQLFLLTDGEVWNVDEVIDITRKNANNTRVFTLGIGKGASTSLVKGIARAGRGKAEFITDSERMQSKVMSLLKSAMQPSITTLDVSWKLPSGVSAVTMPTTPATLFGGDQFILYALLQETAKESESAYAVITIKGKTEKEDVKLTVCFDTACVESPDINAPLHRLAAKTQIKLLHDWEDEGNAADDEACIVTYEEPRDPKKRRVQDLAFGTVPTPDEHSVIIKVHDHVVATPTTMAGSYESAATAKKQEQEERDRQERDRQEERDRKKREQYDKRMLADALMQMVSFQTFQGSWELSTDVCRLLNVDMETVKTEAIFQDTTLVATLLVVAWLNNKWSSRKDEWELIERKTIGWIKSHDLKGRSVAQCLDDSRKLLVG